MALLEPLVSGAALSSNVTKDDSQMELLSMPRMELGGESAKWGVGVWEGGGHSLVIRHLKLVPLFLRVLSTPTAQRVEPAGSRSPFAAGTQSRSPPFPSCSWSSLALKHPALARFLALFGL